MFLDLTRISATLGFLCYGSKLRALSSLVWALLRGHGAGRARLPALKRGAARLTDRCGPQASRPLVIMDAGIATAANLAWLRKRGYDWITVTRGKLEAPPARDPDCQFRSRCGLLVRAWKRAGPEPTGAGTAPADATGPEMRICLWSEQRKQKDDAVLAVKRQRFQRELTALHAGLTRKHCTKRYDKMLERLGRLKQRYRLVSAHYDIVVELDETARTQRKGSRPVLSIAVRRQLNAAGSYELRTSHTDWPLERVVRTYWRQTEVEATFRSLKSEFGLRPVWHRLADRIRAHLFLGVLAFHAVHLLRRRLAGWERVTSTLRTVKGRLIENRQDTRPRPEAERIARAAGVKPQLHRQRA